MATTSTDNRSDSPPTSLLKPYECDLLAYRYVYDPRRGTIALKQITASAVSWIVGIGFNAVAWGFIMLLKHLSATQPSPPPAWFIDVFQIFASFTTVVTLIVGPAVMYLVNRKKKLRLLFDGMQLSYPSLPDWNDIDLTGTAGVALIRGGYKVSGHGHEYGAINQIAVRLQDAGEEFWWPVAGFSFNRRACRRFAHELARMMNVPFYETKTTDRVQKVNWLNKKFVPNARQTPIESRHAGAEPSRERGVAPNE